MNKEVIYIESNDDITTIISKIKSSKAKIIALVPPKKIGVLQSAVNLKLLVRSAKNDKKILIIITNSQSLIRLAAFSKIPIAKSLKSKPELVEIPALEIDEDDDIIDGAELPIGEFYQKVSTLKTQTKLVDEKDDGKLKSSKVKIPDYKKFRKRLFIGFFSIILISGFLVWAIIFAPKAEITIKTRTKTKSIAETINLVEDSNKQNIDQKIIFAQSHSLVKKKTIEFLATGEKEVGEPASGEITIERHLGGPVKVPAGTGFSKGDCTFITQKEITVSGAYLSPGTMNIIPGSAKIKVMATEIGEKCNIKTGKMISTISGIKVEGEEMTGGIKKTVKVVSEQDLAKANQEFDKIDDNEFIKELRNKFDSSVLIINDSLKTENGEKIQPKVDQEAKDGKAKIEQENKYNLFGIARKDINKLVNYLAIKSDNNFKIYQSDDQKVEFADYVSSNDKTSVRVLTKAIVGPNINPNKVKEFSAGKVSGQIESEYEKIDGVDKVKINYSPFWVRNVPKKLEKINVEIDLIN